MPENMNGDGRKEVVRGGHRSGDKGLDYSAHEPLSEHGSGKERPHKYFHIFYVFFCRNLRTQKKKKHEYYIVRVPLNFRRLWLDPPSGHSFKVVPF